MTIRTLEEATVSHPPAELTPLEQQITLYPFRDDNNFWIIEKSLENNNETVGNEYIMNQDIVRLRHVTTQRRLHSHNVRPIFSDKDYINEVR